MSSSRIGPAGLPLAVISDIHGNLEALEAVLSELARRAVVDVFALGDHLLGGDDPLAVWQRLQQIGARCTQGPSDLALARIQAAELPETQGSDQARARRFTETQRALGELIRKQLSQLPAQLRVPMIDGREMLLVHGSPADPLSCMSADMDDEELNDLVGDDPADIIVCGGSHVPFAHALHDIELYNVGSVGQAPEGRFAHFTVIEPKANGADVYQGYVEY